MIALDAMGGDSAPHATVHGAIQAAQAGVPICLFGNEKKIIPLLFSYDRKWEQLPLSFVHCPDTIGMADEPAKTIKQKNSSLVMAMQSVADNKTTAFVSAGNSGSILVAATFIVKRIKGIKRPAIGTFLPTYTGSIFCLDLGANTDCKPEFIEQFALMGHLFVTIVKNIDTPRIGLLSNGHEPYKGSQLTKEVYKRLEHSNLTFVGNIEARDIFLGNADVLVHDGFSGNVMLKTMQATAKAVSYWLKKYSSWWQKLLLYFSPLAALKNKVDYSRSGGALLLGVNKPVVIAHGCSNATAIKNALIYAHRLVEKQIIDTFAHKLQDTVHHHFFPFSAISEKVKDLLHLRK